MPAVHAIQALASWVASLALACPQVAPADEPHEETPRRGATAATGDGVELVVDAPLRTRFHLDDRRATDLQLKFSRAAKSLSRNMVRLSIERAATAELPVTIEVSGFIFDPSGHVVTFGSALAHADRVAVRFVNMPGLRPRRATVVDVDDENDVGVLDIGAIDLPAVTLAAPNRIENGDGVPPTGEATSGEFTTARDPASLMVVSLWGVRGGESPAAIGVLEGVGGGAPGLGGGGPLFRVSVVRRPEAYGGIVARNDGTIVAMLLAPAFSGAPEAPMQPMLAMPATSIQAGVARVLAKAKRAAPRPESGAGRRAWVGLGASDLAEPEFLRQIHAPGAVVVDEVFEASPALAAGIAPHDVLLQWNGRPLRGVDDLSAALADALPGSKVALDCMRHLERRTVEVTLAAW